MPRPEDEMLVALNTIAGVRTDQYKPQDPVQSYVSIAVFADNTRIYYDQWENGFDPNIANPTNIYSAVSNAGGTQIWGDGNPSNGYPPGHTNDLLEAGNVVLLTNAVVSASRGSVIYYDGGDKIGSTKPIAVTRATWASGSSTLFANANEVYDTAFWGTAFVSPVGTNIADAVDCQMFEYTGFSIMAGVGGATVQVDANADGVFETNCVLAEGRSCLINGGVAVGGRLVSDKPVQVDLMTGDIYENFESRFIRLLPTAFWSSSATTPVSTPATVVTNSTTYTAGTTVWLYNPQTNSMSVSYMWRSSAGLATNMLIVPGGTSGGYLRQVVTNGYGARFVATNGAPFYAIATVDSTGTTLSPSGGNGSNKNWDWGFAMVPESSLTPQVLVGLGIGRDPTSATNPREDGSPIWVTPIGNGNSNATVYVDYDSDPTTGALMDPNSNRYDVAYSARELDQLKIYNPSGDQTGMLIYTLTPGVKLAAAWGEDPLMASMSAPGLDMGTGIPPFPSFVAQKKSALLIDADGDGFVTPGDTLRYGIVIENTGRQPVTDLDVKDVLPPGLVYSNNSTIFVNASAVTNAIADNAVPPFQTIFPLDEGGIAFPDPVLPVRSKWEVSYVTRVIGYESLPEGTVSLKNTATVGGSGLTTTNTVTTSIRGRIGGRIWVDDSADGLRSVGEPGVNGVTVALLNVDGTPVFGDDGRPISAVTTNDVGGNPGSYLLVGVVSGTYQLQVVAPPGYVFTDQDADGLGIGGAFNSDVDSATGLTDGFQLKGGEFIETVGAGLQAQSGTIAGAVKLDADGDGVVDPEDTDGFAGATVSLLNASGDPVATASTSTSGEYTFYGVRPGSYTLSLTLPAGYTNTCDAAGANDLLIPVTLAAAEMLTDASFYVARTAATAAAGKVLYLSDPGQALDRIDPVAVGDQTTATTAELYAPAVVSAGNSSSSANASTLTFSHTVGVASNRLLLVGVAVRSTTVAVSSITYGGAALSLVGGTNAASGVRMYIYRLLAPASGTANVVVTLSGTARVAAGASSFSGVDQNTPLGAFVAARGSSAAPSVTVSANRGELIFDTMAVNSANTATADSGQTQLWENNAQSTLAGGSSTKAGATSQTLSWSTGNAAWSIGAVPIRPALGNGAATTFTQSPAFALPFALASGAVIQITNYIKVTSGTMPANPAVVASLSAGGTTFLTVTNPAYSSANGTLIWSGALPSSVSISAGQAITFAVSNAQAGAGFQIRHDSASYPSKIVLPTVSIIAVPSLGVYSAAYPDGVAETDSFAGLTRYIRVIATDPFGSADITSADLAVDGPGASGDVAVSLTDARMVASNAWSKTYEYVWNTALVGSYTLTATGHEGSEGITAVATTTHSLQPAVVNLGDLVWVDANGNGQQDEGEPGLSNVVVRLYNTNSVVVGVVTSAVSGAYVFTNVPVSTYTVGFTPPAGYLFTTSNVGSDATDSDPLPGTNRTALVTLSIGTNNVTVDAGFYWPATLTGFVRKDVNGNGVVEAGDTNGVAGVTVQLLDAAMNVLATAATSAGGAYSFEGLRPGAYTLRETDPADWYSTADSSGANDNLISVTLTSGQSSAGSVFYDTQRTSLGGLAWVDANGNGQQDDGAGSGLSNVVVRLYDTNSVVVAVVTSAVSGAYAFTGQAAGTYTVAFAAPAGYLFTTSNVGSDATDSDPLPGTNRTAAVTLASGQSDSTVAAGFIPAASVAGFVRVDLNGNGVAEAGDTNGVSGVTVQLLDAASNVVAAAETAADGSYSFANLRPGAYTVREVDPSGWYSTADSAGANDNLIPLTLAIGQNSAGNAFYDTQRTALGGLVWLDANGNGQQDGGETAMSNVVVRLYDTNSVVMAVVTSAVSGAYAFTNQAAGTYTVGFAAPAGYLFTTSNVGSDATDSDPLPGTNRTAAVTLVSGQSDGTVAAGFIPAASVAGFVRVDLNGNGVAEAGDTNGVGGVTVQLLDAASNVVAAAATAADGLYSFANLRPGAYTVREVDPSGWYSTADSSGANDNLVSVTLAVGQSSAGSVFYDTQRTSLGGLAWVDANGNGQQDDGAGSGLSNVVVRLYDTNSVVVAVVTSAVSGAYAFTGQAAGTYTVAFAAPAGYLFTTSNVGSDATDSDPLPGTNRTAAVTLVSGQSDGTVAAGFIPATSVAGFVRVDLNGNGAAEAGDTNGVSGVTVQLLDAASNVAAAAVTAADGSYSFANLRPGTYTVREVDPSGWYSTADSSGANDNLIPLTLAVGQSSAGSVFYDTQRTSLGGFAWVDTNGNGQQDDGAGSGLSNVVVRLYDTNSVIMATVTSTVSGAYAFTSLAAGRYTVGFTPPAGYLFTTSNVGSDATDSDPLPGTNRTATVTLLSGQADSVVDAGFFQPVSVTGTVRVDLNGNGAVDAGDTNGIAGVTLRLLDAASNVVATAITSVSGSYSFASLAPGSYTVVQALPSGYTNTLDTAVPNDLRIPVLLSTGQTSAGNTFYDAQFVSISGFVRIDVNGNGTVDTGDTNGVVGATVQLLDASLNVVATAVTAADGSYSFTGIVPGTYTVRETDRAGWYSTADSVGANDNQIPVTLTSGQASASLSFYDTRQTAVGGMAWLDANGDGQQSEGETGMSGVTVTLYNEAGVALASTNSSLLGAYSFTNLVAGTYTVAFAPPAGYLFTTSNVGSDASDSDPLVGTNRTAAVTLTSGQSDSTIAAGFYLGASISGSVRVDLNGDGVVDAGDTAGVSGVTVQLLSASMTVVATAVTGTDGSYGFSDLRPGVYTLRETDLAGWYSTADATAPNDNLSSVTLAIGQASAGNAFYDTRYASIGDRVWVDSNSNGQQDGGELGLAGVWVYLYNAAGAEVARTNSSASGAYAFTNLVAGGYTVGFTPPAGYSFTLSNMGDDATDSDVLAGTNRTATVTLSSGQAEAAVDAGFCLFAALSGTVRLDVDGDGVVDAEDTAGVAGATVLLTDAFSNTVATATTDAAGSYSFADVAFGSYTLVQVLPAGYINTCDAVGANDLRIPVTLVSGQSSAGNAFYDALTGSAVAQNKVLYLSDPAQALDRIDPVAVGDLTATNTALFGSLAWDNTTSVNGSAASATFSHTTGVAENRLLLVGVAMRQGGFSVSGVTYGGSALTRVGFLSNGTNTRMEMWRLIAPPTGANNVVVTMNGSGQYAIGATTFSGVDQTTPLGTFVSASGSSALASVAATSAAGEIVFDTMASRNSASATVGANQTQRWHDSNQSQLTAGGSTEPGAASVTMSWTVGNSAWAIGAVPVKPAGSLVKQATFTQSPAFVLPFSLSSGTVVSITNFVSVVGGTMPVNPSITASLSAGGAPFLSVGNPTYSSAAGTLVWSGALSSNVSIRAGQAISLTVSNAQSDVQFRIRYDSAAYPSKIILPTTSIIAVPSIGVYDAAYPGGNPVSATRVGRTRYIRLTATDPFGAADITGVSLAVDGPGTSADLNLTLSETNLVASTAWSKTFEYVWNTAVQTGDFAITATAQEGTEGVVATATTTEALYYASIGDRVFIDYNRNGVWDAGEGLSGRAVTLAGDFDGDGDSETMTSATDANGYYFFGDLRASADGVAYTLTVDTVGLPAGLTINTVDPDGGANSSSTVVLTLANPVRQDQDFGYGSALTYTINGRVRDDNDLNGDFSAPDQPVGGVWVTLYTDPNGDGNPADGVALRSVLTSLDGLYVFSNVVASAYVVVESDPGVSVSRADTASLNDNRIPVVIVAGDSVNNDFLDAIDPAGYLYDVEDGRFVTGGSISVSGPCVIIQMDGSSGKYMFISTNSVSSAYTITVTPPAGYMLDPTRTVAGASFDPTGRANPTALGSYESAVKHGYLTNFSAVSNAYYLVFELEPGDPLVINNNIPLVKTVALGDRVWEDLDGDGVQDAGEPGVTNVTVRLLSATNSVVASAVTGADGSYLFTNLPPASYSVEFVKPSGTAFTVRDAASATDASDSDADKVTGRSAQMACSAGTTNLTVDAGLYVPAVVDGYLFVDKNGDLLRNTGDSSLTNALVRLAVGTGVVSTVTDVYGHYRFENVAPGAVTVLVSRISKILAPVPTQEPDASDMTRNRALPDALGFDAYIAFNVVSGFGVLAGRGNETLNAGFSSASLSTAIDFWAYASGRGGVKIDIWTVNESGYSDIVVYAWIGNAWVEVGRVPAEEIVGEGSNKYTVAADGLSPDGAYFFRIVDEAGHVHDSPGTVGVTRVKLNALRFEMNTAVLTFYTEHGYKYVVKVSDSLNAPEEAWTAEFVSVQKGGGWSSYSDQPFMAGPGTQTAVRIPVNRQKAFFKIVLVE